MNPVSDQITWEYQGNPAISFYSQAISSSERLPNGNTLICEGSPGRIFEVTLNKEIVWEYVNPFFVPGGGNDSPELINGVFRAHRYGPDHSALRNKEINPGNYGNINRLYGRA